MQTNKLREALTKILNLTNSLDENCAVDPVEIRDIARAALAEPARNCDVPKVMEDPWRAWLDDESNWDEDGNPKLEIHDWLFAPATEKEGGGR